MADLEPRLRAALADRYVIERELGAGGMAVVFLARDTKLGRPVALKVLRPELAAALGAERFLREIAIAATLTHPNILGLHDCGEADGLPYYVMPYLGGESLRDRLTLEKQLAIEDALQIAKEVADALGHAHALGIVHRDIKPENILFEAGHAVVSDFGIARAVTAAGGETLTETGLAIGTLAYMSPEQAAGGKDIDGRSDLYSLGCVLYEMLSGEAPHSAATPQALVAKKLGASVPRISVVREAVPATVESVLAKALAGTPADRYRTAGEMAAALDGARMPAPSAPAAVSLNERPLWQILAAYAVASLVALAASGTLTDIVGLPSWVPPITGVMCLAGLPLVLATAVLQRNATGPRAGVSVPPATRLRRWLTWRTAALSGAAAFGLLATSTSGYMGMRVMGIGPVGTLWATGALDAEAPLVLADFGTRSVDSVLVFTVTDAFRVDLSQSRTVKLLDQAIVADVLRLMERDPTQPLGVETARELATREGLKAVIAGEVNTLGSGFALSVRLVVAETGEELVSFRETANEPDAIIPAIERLSRRLRDRIGESLRMARRNPRLHRTRTASLEALKRYSEGNLANARGDFARCVTLLTDAITLDTLFAGAYLLRGFCYTNLGRGSGGGGYADLTRAFELRDRVTASEQAEATAGYYGLVRGEWARAAETLEAHMDLYPDDLGPRNDLSVYYVSLRESDRAEAVLLPYFDALAVPPAITWFNLVTAQLNQGKYAVAEETLRRWEEAMPGNDMIVSARLSLATSRRDYAGTQAILDAPIEIPFWRAISSYWAAGLAAVQGKRRETERYLQYAPLSGHERLAFVGLARLITGDTAGAAAAMEEGLALADALPPHDRPYLVAAELFAYAGRPGRARESLAEWDRVTNGNQQSRERARRRGAEGVVILAEGRPEDAVPHLRFAHEQMSENPNAYLPELAAAYEQAGEPDSALATYQRYLNTPWWNRLSQDAFWLAGVYERLATLYERRGDVERALEFYGEFVDLWRDADPELQPRVDEARAALVRLTRERSE